ncbi:protein FAM133B-like [Ambystoma mexicanum]|uniref:protein FAM133B-like n=1 Tax=Ambystoma mexicanum TaxID=8296 RepID=UPI0037E8FD87
MEDALNASALLDQTQGEDTQDTQMELSAKENDLPNHEACSAPYTAGLASGSPAGAVEGWPLTDPLRERCRAEARESRSEVESATKLLAGTPGSSELDTNRGSPMQKETRKESEERPDHERSRSVSSSPKGREGADSATKTSKSPKTGCESAAVDGEKAAQEKDGRNRKEGVRGKETTTSVQAMVHRETEPVEESGRKARAEQHELNPKGSNPNQVTKKMVTIQDSEESGNENDMRESENLISDTDSDSEKMASLLKTKKKKRHQQHNEPKEKPRKD